MGKSWQPNGWWGRREADAEEAEAAKKPITCTAAIATKTKPNPFSVRCFCCVRFVTLTTCAFAGSGG